MWRRRNAYGKSVLAGSPDEVRHIEFAAQECTLESAQFVAIEPDFGGVIHAEKGEGEPMAVRRGRRPELHAIPVILMSERLGDGHVVQAIVGIGIYAAIHHRRQNRTRDRCRQPVLVSETRFGNLLAAGLHLWHGSQPPTAANVPWIVTHHLRPKVCRLQRPSN